MDVFFRPDRLKYVKRKKSSKKCIFCEVAKKRSSFKTLCFYKDKNVMLLLNKYPYNTGHVLVSPIRHKSQLFDLTENEKKALILSLSDLTKVLKKIFKCEGINLGLNLGKVAGSSIPDHLHFHVIPRWSGDTNFFPLVSKTKLIPQSLKQVYDELKKSYLKKKKF